MAEEILTPKENAEAAQSMSPAHNRAGAVELSLALIDDITVPERHRDLDPAKVAMLVESMGELGQLHPIMVFRAEDSIILVAGRRRLEAARQLGWDCIQCIVCRGR